MRLGLPVRPRRAWLRAFGLAVGLWLAVAVALLAPLELWPRMVLAGAVVAAAELAARTRHREVSLLYRAWGRLSRMYASLARGVLLRLGHMIVLTVVGLAGSGLQLRRPDPAGSFWVSRATLSPSVYDSQFEGAGSAWAGRPWTAVLVWAIRSGNGWAVVLIPLLALLSALEGEEQTRYPSGIYTLF